MKLVGLIGAAGSGKSTVAQYLRNARGYFTAAFATPSRDMLNVLLRHLGIDPRWDDRQWKETPLPGIGKSPRQLHQTLGTEWGRDLVNPGLWLQTAALDLALSNAIGCRNVVFEDVRFRNEAQWVLDQGGLLIHLIRPDARPVAAHSSEQTNWDGIERHEVVNNAGLDGLFRLVDHVLDTTAALTC